MRALRMVLAVGCALGCSTSRERPDGGAGPSDGGRDASAVCDGGVLRRSAIDLLFVVDDSALAEELASLAEQLPRLIEAIATGDGDGDGAPDFDPPERIHAGVITMDMGTGGFPLRTCDEPEFGHDGILRTEGNLSVPGCEPSYPPFLEFRRGSGSDSAALATDLQCLLPGAWGCGWEQPLEAALKAVTPASSSIRFFRDTTGHADGANAGFLQPGGTLVVVVLMDEDDCSVLDPELYDLDSTVYEDHTDIRCFRYPEAVHPVSRYVEGLLEVVDRPQQLLFVPIAGVPTDLAGDDYERILADDRMQKRPDPTDPNRLEPSCSEPGRGLSFPPRRLVDTARGLAERGALTSAQSICQADLSPATDAILGLLARRIHVSVDCAP